MFGLSGKTALITGAASGVGRTIAEGLVQAGARVMIVSRKADACKTAAEEINKLGGAGVAEGFRGDISNAALIEQLSSDVRQRILALDILVNNAGLTWGAPFEAFPYDAWDRILRVNLSGLFTLTREMLPLLQKAGTRSDPSRVINIGSVMGYSPLCHGAYSYAASKAAVHHLTTILAKEYAGRGITFNALALGPFPSKMTAFAYGEGKSSVQQLPSGRMGSAADIVAPVLYLCGLGGSYTTGAVIPVDGGVSVQSCSLFESL